MNNQFSINDRVYSIGMKKFGTVHSCYNDRINLSINLTDPADMTRYVIRLSKTINLMTISETAVGKKYYITNPTTPYSFYCLIVDILSNNQRTTTINKLTQFHSNLKSLTLRIEKLLSTLTERDWCLITRSLI